MSGCYCQLCYGLAEHMQAIGRPTYGLPEMPGHDRAVLRVVTRDEQTSVEAVACDGSMTCSCESCVAERASRVRRGVRPSAGLPVKHAA